MRLNGNRRDQLCYGPRQGVIRLRFLFTALTVTLFITVAPAETGNSSSETYSLEELYEMGMEWVKEATPSQIWEEYETPSFAEWRRFLEDLQGILNGDSYDALAAWLPYARDALNSLRQLPLAAPYADWLAQRLDYFEVADEVVKAVAPARPSIKPPPPVHHPSQPPPKPVVEPAPPPPSEVQIKRNRMAHDLTTWRRRAQVRPAPARAAELAPLLKSIFREEGIPEALIWIAEVESSFNPKARSPMGAAGLFQFMPATAERFGLSLQPSDQRLDPHHSARAAARYLRTLYGQFADWPLVLAAYNAGEGRVSRLLKARGTRTFSTIENDLPIETRMYVPKVLATIEVREGVSAEMLAVPAPRARNEEGVNEMFARVE